VLRITQQINSHTTTLKLEGKLLEAWAQELRDAVETARANARPVQLDLHDLEYADRAGAELLRNVLDQGVTLASCSGFISELLGRTRSR
jgi:anti-anti-sigma regulatory factor